MDAKRILHIGIGRCGNKQVDAFLKADPSARGILFNSYLQDMNGLDCYDKGAKGYQFPHMQGGGGDRAYVQKEVDKNITPIYEELLNYSSYKHFIIYFSTDGGTGSGAFYPIAKAIRKLYPKAKIMLMPTLPKLNVGLGGLKNSMDAIKQLSDLLPNHKEGKKGVINSYRFIDNGRATTLDEVNKKMTREILTSLRINSFTNTKGDGSGGGVDLMDSERVNFGDGYISFLQLSNEIKNPSASEIENFRVALHQARENSVFLHSLDLRLKDIAVLTKNFSQDVILQELKYPNKRSVGTSEKGDYLVGVYPEGKFPISKINKILGAIKELESIEEEESKNYSPLSSLFDDDYKTQDEVIEEEEESQDVSFDGINDILGGIFDFLD